MYVSIVYHLLPRLGPLVVFWRRGFNELTAYICASEVFTPGSGRHSLRCIVCREFNRKAQMARAIVMKQYGQYARGIPWGQIRFSCAFASDVAQRSNWSFSETTIRCRYCLNNKHLYVGKPSLHSSLETLMIVHRKKNRARGSRDYFT